MEFYYEASSLYYGSDCTDSVDSQWPNTDCPVWILGNELSAKLDITELNEEIRSRLLFTYRKDFSEIDESGYTSDSGWGCMLRCGQMVLGEALQRVVLGRDWKWSRNNHTVDKDTTVKYINIVHLFQDSKVAPYSIHQIALMGESIQSKKPVGTWFGPNTVAQVLRKLSIFENSIPINIHIAMDNTIIVDEIKESCSYFGEDSAGKPLILFIPLRLGLTEINPIYFQDLKECFEFPQVLGVIGGRPNHALYFIGYVDNELIYLDPHVSTQVANKVSNFGDEEDQTYHTERAYRMDFKDLDPSLSLCFLCKNESEFDDLCQRFLFKLIRGHNSPLFEICRQRPEHLEACSPNQDLPNLIPDENTGKEYEEIRHCDTSDEDFEIL
ncbi:cysteine protease ATG4B [Lepeophtheirus salmonis]|uniref:cysteine protease ATG4B n=1 Tax=Lepeophtheirus salmonis TaxID=72036 RepID=UPI001AE4B06D|nr:cysteine protease ATG4B-like [Lepeophtheirus salmonis]